MAFLAGLWFSRLLRVEGMGSVAAVTLVLNVVAPFAESFFQRVGESLVLAVLFHPVPGDGMSAFLELVKFFCMALAADLGFHRRFFGLGLFMALMAGDAIYPTFGMFAVDPGLKNSPGVFLVAGQAVADLFLSPQCGGRRKEEKQDRSKNDFSQHGNLLIDS